MTHRPSPLRVFLLLAAASVLAAVAAGRLALAPSGAVVNVKLNDPWAGLPAPTPASPPLPGVDWYLLDRIHGNVVYILDQDVQHQVDLHSVPVDRSRAPVMLSLPEHDSVRFGELTPDGARVVYLADTWPRNGLFSVPTDGSQTAVRLSPPLLDFHYVAWVYRLTPDGSQVVFAAETNQQRLFELHSAPVDGSSPAVLLSGPFVPGGTGDRGAEEMQVSPDGTRVAYLADQDTPFLKELFVVPLEASSPPVKLAGPPDIDAGILADFRFTPDGARVVYRMVPDIYDPGYEGAELFSVPIDGSVPAVRLSASLAAGDKVYEYSILPSGSVVYRTGTEIFGVPSDGSLLPVRLNQPGPTSRVTSFRINDADRSVVYCADETVDDRFELYSVPDDGSASPLALGTALGGGSTRDFRLVEQTHQVVFVLRPDSTFGPQPRVLYALPLDGSTPPIRLTPPEQGSVDQFVISPNGSQVAFRAADPVGWPRQLYVVPIHGGAAPVRVNGPMVTDGSISITSRDDESWFPPGFQFFDERRIVYTADQETFNVVELFASFLAPAISGVTPNRGPSRGGNTVTLTGCNLAATTEVFFDGRPATSVKALSTSELRVGVPRGVRLPPPTRGPASGKTRQALIHERTVDVTVSEEGTLDTLSAAYTYYPGE